MRVAASRELTRHPASIALAGGRRFKPLLSTITLTAFLAGCANPEGKVEPATGDKAFISYWGSGEDTDRLRLAVKDNIDVRGAVTTAGSEQFATTRSPAAQDAACMAGARAAGVEIVGKTNVTEFAVAVSGVNGYFGTPRNPLARRQRIIPGGSSSGSAVAVANGMADVAFGTDTAGSIRVPAAACGIYGLKTTFGLIPLKGVVPISPKHLDTVGPMAKDIPTLVEGMALLKSGFEAEYRSATAAKPRASGITIGRLYVDGTDPEIDRAIDTALTSRGFRVVKLGPKFKEAWEQAEADGRTIAHVDAWISDRKYLEGTGITSQTRAIIATGEPLYNTTYPEALSRTGAWKRTMREVFRNVDFVALPVLKQPAPRTPLFGGLLFEGRVLALQNTVAANLSGNPALAVPVPVDGRIVPGVSLQLIGPMRSEAQLLNAGRLLEAGTVSQAAAHNLVVRAD